MSDDSAPAGSGASRSLPQIDRDELVARIAARLQRTASRPAWHAMRARLVPVEPAAYTLIVGAGFSAGSVPMVRELMRQTIGDYDAPDQDQSSVPRSASLLQRRSRDFWRDYNAAAQRLGRTPVGLDGRGLPMDCGEAYRSLFAFDVARELLRETAARQPAHEGPSVVEKLAARRRADRAAPVPVDLELGEKYVQGFLQFTVAPGSEHGDGLTGRATVNPAHQHLARLLAAQQSGALSRLKPFCRTVFTTNFDTLLQVALQAERIVPVVSDRPERGFDAGLFAHEAAIHLVYTHGSVLRNNPASAAHELAGLSAGNVEVLGAELGRRDVVAIGHSGWADSLTAALRRCGADGQHLYWCDVGAEPGSDVLDLFHARGGAMTWVRLGDPRSGGGADGLMRALNEALHVPAA